MTTAAKTYTLRHLGADAGRIVVTDAGEIRVEAASPHDAIIAAILADMREHGIVDLGIASLKAPIFVEGADLFYALWKRLLMMGYVLERVDGKE